MPSLQIDRHLEADSFRAALEADVRAGLTATPKTLPPKYFYDARGSELFGQITMLPEYYPTRRERAILAERAGEIAALTGADTIVELGSGSSDKTRLLLDAFGAAGLLRQFVPFDVDESVLLQASSAICAQYPGIAVHAVVGDFEHHLPLLPRDGRRLVAFLGGTIGNLLPSKRETFLDTLVASMNSGDFLLLGADLVKDERRLIAAYDDAQGVTAEFNLNVLRVLQRELDADIDVDAFSHVVRWDAEAEWIEMRLRSQREQVIHVLDLQIPVERGEEIRTEISAKFRPDGIEAELKASGLAPLRFWTDVDGDFGLSLATKP